MPMRKGMALVGLCGGLVARIPSRVSHDRLSMAEALAIFE